jgi:hypothetical protein
VSRFGFARFFHPHSSVVISKPALVAFGQEVIVSLQISHFYLRYYVASCKQESLKPVLITSTGSKSLKLAKRSASVNRDYFGKFGDGQSKENRALQVRAMTGHGMDSVQSLHSRRLTRATGLSCALCMSGAANDVTPVPATHRDIAVIGTFHSRRFTRASLRLLHPCPISNRESNLLETTLSHCKQATATVSNRELWTVRYSTISTVLAALPARGNQSPLQERRSRPAISDTNSRPVRPFLTGSASETEFHVTPRKQTTEKFLTGARTHISDFAIWRILR